VKKLTFLSFTDLSTFQTDFESPPSPNRSRSRDRNKFVGLEQLCPLPESLEFDVKWVKQLLNNNLMLNDLFP